MDISGNVTLGSAYCQPNFRKNGFHSNALTFSYLFTVSFIVRTRYFGLHRFPLVVMVPDLSLLLIDAFPVVRHRTLDVWRSKWACEAWISPSAGRHTALPADEPVSSVWSASGLCFGCEFVNDDTSAADSLAIA